MSEQQENAIDAPHPLHTLLWRIAAAFEQQNSINLAWVEQQKQWHEETEKLNAARYREATERDNRFLAIREESAAREQVMHDRQLAIMEKTARQVEEYNRSVYVAQLNERKAQEKAVEV